MRILPSPSLEVPGHARPSHRSWSSPLSWFGLLLAACLAFSQTVAQGEEGAAAKDEFSQLVKLAPFVVKGQSLAISIYARTNSDRRYGEQFAKEVIEVVYEAVTESTGKGLVIIGAKGEPHPIFVFRKFLALAKDGKLDPAIAARGPELSQMMDRWQHFLNKGDTDDGKKGDSIDLEYDKIVTALPLPLEGIGAKLYQLAWEEKFDEAKVEAKLRLLRPGDLERRDLFKRFDWAFYLPPKGAFNKVLDDLINDALKQEEVGFFARITVKGALLVVKPKIRRMIEALRHGMMFMTVVQARTQYGENEVASLTEAYIKPFMPGEKSAGGSDHERAVNAVREQLRELEEKARVR